MTDLLGQSLGSYRLDALLAAGPTGYLYSGRHLRLGRPAAVKLFDPALVARPGARPRLMAALREVATLRHPRVAAIYDVGDEDGRLFVAAEPLPGGSLRALTLPGAREAVPLAVRLELVAQAAEALAAAHAAGLVHGAVKPESLWLERALEAGPPALKLADLGVAAALPEEALGAPAYLSPEKCLGRALDGRSDLYSLGVVLYELLVGAPPFNVQTVEAAVEKHLRTRPVPPRLVRPALPAEVEAIALRCLAKSPDERYPDAAALVAALRNTIASLAPAPVAPPPPPTLPPLAEQPTVVAAAPAAAAPAPRLQILSRDGALLRTADLGAGVLTVGRAAERDLFLDDPQVSREHLRVEWDGRQITVADLASANGTFLGGARLAPNQPTLWDGRAPLRVGPFTLRVEQAAGQPEAPDSLLSGLLGGAPAAAPRPARVELFVDQERLSLTPGAPALIPLRLTNTGDAVEEVFLSVEGVPGAWLREDDQGPIRLGPGEQAAASLTVSVPRAPDALAGDYNVLVRARPRNGAAGGEARLRWTVLPFAGLELRVAPPRAETRAAADYQVLLRNTGNGPATYFLTFEDADDLLGYALERDEVALEAGQTERVGLRVEAAGRLFGGPEERPFVVRADDGRHEAAVAEAQIVHQATLPAWVPLAALAALALGLLLGAWLIFGGPGAGGVAGGPTPSATALPPTLTPFPTPLPGAPAVEVFTAQPQVVAPGEVVIVSWRVQGAERVFIDQFGDVPPEGQREFRPEQTTDFRLVAIAPGGRETVVIARVNVAPPTPLPATATPITPTVIPPTAVPPTAVPPTAVPPTAVPPTAVPPTAVPPTAVPPTAVPPVGDGAVDLVALAPDATWRTGEGEAGFGRPFFGADRGGWAAVADATLEDGQQYEDLLQMVPPAAATGAEVPFIEGEFAIPAAQTGQILVGSLGFADGAAAGQSVTVTVTFDGQILYQGATAADGQLQPLFVDLTPLAGRAGNLALRVSAPAGSPPGGLYWLRPRLDVPR